MIQLPPPLSPSHLSTHLMLDSTTVWDHWNLHLEMFPIPLPLSQSMSPVSWIMSLVTCVRYGVPSVPAPEVSLSVPSGPLHQGTSLTLSCTATLPPSVDTDVTVTVTIQWTHNNTDNRITITPASSLQSPFISTLTICPLATTDTGMYTCVASANSTSQYITSSGRGEPDQETVTVTGVLLP